MVSNGQQLIFSQHNVGRCLAVMNLLGNDISSYDVVAIQTPYLLKDWLVGATDSMTAVVAALESRAVLLILNTGLQFLVVSTRKGITAFEIETGVISVLVASVYMYPSEDMTQVIIQLETLLKSTKDVSVLLHGDLKRSNFRVGRSVRKRSRRQKGGINRG